jgi:ABC-type lipoprotein export system ATPase subunit
MIVGPSGSGNTTLLNLIGCIDKPTQGTIFAGGQDVGTLNDNAISDFRAQRVGFDTPVAHVPRLVAGSGLCRPDHELRPH